MNNLQRRNLAWTVSRKTALPSGVDDTCLSGLYNTAVLGLGKQFSMYIVQTSKGLLEDIAKSFLKKAYFSAGESRGLDPDFQKFHKN